MAAAGAGMFLVNYSSSSSEEEEEGPAGAGPGVRAEGGAGSGAQVKSQCLPVPDSVMGMFKESEEDPDDSSKHDGRIRSFPHQRGNWSTLVYLEYYPEEEFVELIDLLLTHLQAHRLPMARIAEFHISLSQTVVLRYHWISIFVESLKEKMTTFDRFYCVSDKVKIYSNQEKTRTFLGLEVSAGSNYLLELVNEVDKSMEEFDLKTYHQAERPKFLRLFLITQTFYTGISLMILFCTILQRLNVSPVSQRLELDTVLKSPSFHISVAWCLGDATAELEKHQQELQGTAIKNTLLQSNSYLSFIDWNDTDGEWMGVYKGLLKLELGIVDKFENSARILRIYADQVRCKTGKKIFSFPLR